MEGETKMASAAALHPGTFCLELRNYAVVPLNSKLSPHIPKVMRALKDGVPAFADNRAGFYDIELDGGWAYIHVREDARTVYLVAFSRN